MDWVGAPHLSTCGGSLTVGADERAGVGRQRRHSRPPAPHYCCLTRAPRKVSSNAAAQYIYYPALQNTGGSVNISSNGAIVSLQMPQLTAVGGSLIVRARLAARVARRCAHRHRARARRSSPTPTWSTCLCRCWTVSASA
jgi:hypothetical protein